ncbi:MAG: preprotein translocase subunit YajC [Lawsonibacter sp.]
MDNDFHVLIVLMFAIVFTSMIRPENKRKKEGRICATLAVGDKITTIGGITGTICAVKEHHCHRDRRRPRPHRDDQVGRLHQGHQSQARRAGK